MNVYDIILTWSQERPKWLRDALRRLVVAPTIVETDLEALLALAKEPHFPASVKVPVPFDPLTAAHIPKTASALHNVSLLQLRDLQHVNAIIQAGPLSLAPKGLTVAYGDNGSGKSGFARVLKRACRARGRGEPVQPNIYGPAASAPASAIIDFTTPSGSATAAWNDGASGCADLCDVSVFDSHCAGLYVRERGELAFRPAGLDLFDKVARVATTLQERINQEKAALQVQMQPLPDVGPGTAAQKAVSGLGPLTSKVDLNKLAALSDSEKARMAELGEQLVQLAANDPVKKALELKAQAGRLSAFRDRLKGLQQSLSDPRVEELRAAQADARTKAEAANLASTTAFADLPVPGVGSEAWKALWESAKRYSEGIAYPSILFPNTADGAACVLCQQPLGGDGQARMQRFRGFIQQDTSLQAKKAAERLEALAKQLREIPVVRPEDGPVLEELGVVDAAGKDRAVGLLEAVRDRQGALVTGLVGKLAESYPEMPQGVVEEVQVLVDGILARAQGFEALAAPQERVKLDAEFRELSARAKLFEHLATVLGQRDRLESISRLTKVLEGLDTKGLTRKNTELSNAIITQQLGKRFEEELTNLSVGHVKVTVQPSGGERGKTFHRLETPGTKANVALDGVLSEGEHRCVALAAFFAELSLSESKSAAVLDDPVSSLDHVRRELVARRIVREAKERQVVVFTHDLVFLMFLQAEAEREEVDVHLRTIQKETQGPGGTRDGGPWDGMSTKERIGSLRHRAQALRPRHKKGPIDEYERDAVVLYGRLREAWERAAEEVLLNGVVTRFAMEIHTKQIKTLVDIEAADYEALDAGMAKCSTWLHDGAPAVNVPVPGPDEVETDVNALANWVDAIRARRQKKKPPVSA